VNTILKRCEVCGEKPTIFRTFERKGTRFQVGLCEECEQSPEAAEAIERKYSEAAPIASHLPSKTKQSLLVVMQFDSSDDYSHMQASRPIAIFHKEKNAESFINSLKTESLLNQDWAIEVVPLEDEK
jgi:hypothetical protein